MAKKKDPQKNIKVYAPDLALWNKIGRPNLDQILTPQIIELAQNIILQSSQQFLDESAAHLQDLERLGSDLQKSPDKAHALLPRIVRGAFSLKSKAGLGGYDLISELAKSLQLQCEELEGNPVTTKNIEIIDWHITSMRRLFADGAKGTGGKIGVAIANELKRLN